MPVPDTEDQDIKNSQPYPRRAIGFLFQRVLPGLALVMLAAASLLAWGPPAKIPQAKPPQQAAMPNPLDADRSFKYLTEVCNIGTRVSGTAGMAKQQKLITDHFVKFGCQVKLQPFDAPHPVNGNPVRMNNIIISWHPESKERILLCAHYDTRPFPDREKSPAAQRGVFIGANDGASGVALFMELAHHMEKLKPNYGVDFVLFDGEELVYGPRGDYFLGSKHFARHYRDEPPVYRYKYGILVDMIAGKKLNLYYEGSSMRYAPELAESVWATAQRLHVHEFIAKPKHDVQDDHLPLNEIAGIPSIDLIDFDYEFWHTRKDIPANCTGVSIAKVGHVLLEWMTEKAM
jgi:glutaminyl-peptide cyclotransferase